MTKLIEESTVSKTVKNAIDTDKLLDWLVENSVLSIALEGNNSTVSFYKVVNERRVTKISAVSFVYCRKH